MSLFLCHCAVLWRPLLLLTGYRHRVHPVVVLMMQEAVMIEIRMDLTFPCLALFPICVLVPLQQRMLSAVLCRHHHSHSVASHLVIPWNRFRCPSAVPRPLYMMMPNLSPSYRHLVPANAHHHYCDLTRSSVALFCFVLVCIYYSWLFISLFWLHVTISSTFVHRQIAFV